MGPPGELGVALDPSTTLLELGVREGAVLTLEVEAPPASAPPPPPPPPPPMGLPMPTPVPPPHRAAATAASRMALAPERATGGRVGLLAAIRSGNGLRSAQPRPLAPVGAGPAD